MGSGPFRNLRSCVLREWAMETPASIWRRADCHGRKQRRVDVGFVHTQRVDTTPSPSPTESPLPPRCRSDEQSALPPRSLTCGTTTCQCLLGHRVHDQHQAASPQPRPDVTVSWPACKGCVAVGGTSTRPIKRRGMYAPSEIVVSPPVGCSCRTSALRPVRGCTAHTSAPAVSLRVQPQKCV